MHHDFGMLPLIDEECSLGTGADNNDADTNNSSIKSFGSFASFSSRSHSSWTNSSYIDDSTSTAYFIDDDDDDDDNDISDSSSDGSCHTASTASGPLDKLCKV
jgi:hypothetical protein